MRMKKRGFALVLALVLALSLLPISAFATEGETKSIYEVGATYTSATDKAEGLPINIPANTSWKLVGEAAHTHEDSCVGDPIELNDTDLGSFTDSEGVSQEHMWKETAGGAWWALDCVDDDADNDADHDADNDADHDDDNDADHDDDNDADHDDDHDDDNDADDDDDADHDDTNDADDDNDADNENEQPDFTRGADHQPGGYNGHAAGCYGRRVVPAENNLLGTINGVKAIYTFKATTVADWYRLSCNTQYTWELVENPIVEAPATEYDYTVELKYFMKKGETSYTDFASDTMHLKAAELPTVEALLSDNTILPADKTRPMGTTDDEATYYRTSDAKDVTVNSETLESGNLVYTVKYYRYEQPKTTKLTISVVLNGLDPADRDTLTKASNKADAKSLRYSLEAAVVRMEDLDWKDLPKTYYTGLTAMRHTLVQYNAEVPGYDLETTYVGTGNAAKGASTDAGYQIDIKSGDNGTITIINTYTKIKKPATTGTLTIHKEFAGDLPVGTVPANLSFTLSGDENFPEQTLPYAGKFPGGTYTTNELQPGTYTITETGADVEGYTWAADCVADTDPTLDGYQFEVKVGESTEITIVNTYDKIPETVYSLIFEAGDYGSLAPLAENNEAISTYHYVLDTNSNRYIWERVQTGNAASPSTHVYQFTKEDLARSAPSVTAQPNLGYQSVGFQMTLDGSPYLGDETAIGSGRNGLQIAYDKMLGLGVIELTFRATYSGGGAVNPPVNPPVNPTDPAEPETGYGPGENPLLPETLPEPEVPLAPLPGELVTDLSQGELTDLPDSETPLAELPDEETPLAALPEEEVPLAEAPKTGDSFGIWAALLGISGLAMAALTLGKRKETPEN